MITYFIHIDFHWFFFLLFLGANTYLTINGPTEQASFRINFAQSFNGLASAIAPIVASYAFFGGNDSQTNNLDTVKYAYVGIGCCKCSIKEKKKYKRKIIQ